MDVPVSYFKTFPFAGVGIFMFPMSFNTDPVLFTFAQGTLPLDIVPSVVMLPLPGHVPIPNCVSVVACGLIVSDKCPVHNV
ncbi:membrane protein [Candidatus Magnetobacterium bavaricum]|uniref:Membrane protein n=1 Tax=Candidatus Magnetobacterium bavaricum TaxID=29290 RepID=A0A0F3GRL0_9BACT|nr:membrane protein [Candidatus Magnetobacterium bavaricum]